MSATNSLLPTGNAAEPLWFIHNLAYVHIDGSETDDAFDLGEVWGARGDMLPVAAEISTRLYAPPLAAPSMWT